MVHVWANHLTLTQSLVKLGRIISNGGTLTLTVALTVNRRDGKERQELLTLLHPA